DGFRPDRVALRGHRLVGKAPARTPLALRAGDGPRLSLAPAGAQIDERGLALRAAGEWQGEDDPCRLHGLPARPAEAGFGAALPAGTAGTAREGSQRVQLGQRGALC